MNHPVPSSADGAGPRPPAEAEIVLITSERSWIEQDALDQLQRTARLSGMRKVVGLPDLHPGKGFPVGMACLSAGIAYPFLVGNDIGCGMGLWQTDRKAAKPKLDAWVKALQTLEGPPADDQAEQNDRADWLARFDATPTAFDAALGSIGGGNHFAELQKVAEIQDEAGFRDLGLDAARLFLLVHSGSRGLGQDILERHLATHGQAGLAAGTADAEAYQAEHDNAVRWARANRARIAQRFLTVLRAEATPVLDLVHNSVTPTPAGWLHRKGAAPADAGPLVIPGSRGSFSYLVVPTGDGAVAAWSLAHGAGRRWPRAEMKARLQTRYSVAELERTALGGRVICADRALIYEEAPEAYKRIEQVIEDLQEAGLIRVIAVLTPLITYKTAKGTGAANAPPRGQAGKRP